MSPAEPAMKDSAPGEDVGLDDDLDHAPCHERGGRRGLDTTGIPASSARAIFSKVPHARKLKALMCTATPGRGSRTCWPTCRSLTTSRPVELPAGIAQ